MKHCFTKTILFGKWEPVGLEGPRLSWKESELYECTLKWTKGVRRQGHLLWREAYVQHKRLCMEQVCWIAYPLTCIHSYRWDLGMTETVTLYLQKRGIAYFLEASFYTSCIYNVSTMMFQQTFQTLLGRGIVDMWDSFNDPRHICGKKVPTGINIWP